MKTISETVNSYVAGLSNFKLGNDYKLGDIKYSLKFDPNSYGQVLLFFTEESNQQSIQFASTDVGIFIRAQDETEPDHYFYHTLMYTLDFGFTLTDLANIHYIFKEMKKLETK